ncbi:MAG: peptide ABC transporter substrate-binding protein [Bdellovibrionaceae bacterium]|nr:peptide ABC transporter substrate-binding protein [Pseudobdellovibrionaceae bacterium]
MKITKFLLLPLIFQCSTQTIYASKSVDKVLKGGSVVLSLDEEPESLHPVSSISGYANEVQSWVCDSLLNKNPETYEWEQALAEKWKISDDNKSITFTLRKNLVFHDGKPITAQDVKFSIDVMKDERYDNKHIRNYFENVESVTIIDENTVKVVFKTNYFKNIDVVAKQLIIPKHIYDNPEKSNSMVQSLVCSGAYKLSSFVKGQGIDLVKFDQHYTSTDSKYKNLYNYEQIKYRFLLDENIKLEKIKKGEIDFVEWRNSEIFEKKAVGELWGKEIIKYKIENKIPKIWSYIGWNLEKVLFKDKNVRLALAHLANREEINKKFFNNNSLLVSAPISPLSEYAPKTKPITFNPKIAAALLKKAGWKDVNRDGILEKEINGKKVDFKFTLVFANREYEKLWTILKEDMKNVGIEMNLKIVDFNQMLKIKDELSFDALALSWGGGSVDPDPKQIWHSTSAVKGGSNFIGYRNSEVDKLIDEARMTIDRKKRIGILQKTYQLIAEDAPYLFMFSDRYSYYATTVKIKKQKPTFNYSVGSNSWWLEK